MVESNQLKKIGEIFEKRLVEVTSTLKIDENKANLSVSITDEISMASQVLFYFQIE